MARLRRGPDDSRNTSYTGQQRIDDELSPSPQPARRRAARRVVSDESSAEESDHTSRLVPKTRATTKSDGAPVRRLVPLNMSRGLSAVDIEEIRKTPRSNSKRQIAQQSSIDDSKIPEQQKRSHSPQLSRNRRAHIEETSRLTCRSERLKLASAFEHFGAGESDEDTDEIDIEESVWCGSDAGTQHSSDDEEGRSPVRELHRSPSDRVDSKGSCRIQFKPDSDIKLRSLSLFEDIDSRVPAKHALPASKQLQYLSKRDDRSGGTSAASLEQLVSPSREGAKPDYEFERPVTPPPASPAKAKLQSPSKRVPRIPTPPLRPSLDAFWTANAVNEWNDQYSPQKPLKSPRKLDFRPETSEPKSPTASPRKSPTKRTKAEIQSRKDFDAQKAAIAESFLKELDQIITQGRIASLSASTGGVQLIWSNTLNSTAGRANWRRETTKSHRKSNPDGKPTTTEKHYASIDLASKVIDSEHRLLNVMAHEFCHLANFMISGVKDQPHGASFKRWGKLCSQAFGDRGVEVTTKHTYEIEYKYIWQCCEELCGVEFKRHSKSIDPVKHRCGACRGTLVQVKPVPRTPAAKKGGDVTTGYAAYVKQHFAGVKKNMTGASHKEVMEALGRKYRAEKDGKADAVGGLAKGLEKVKLGDVRVEAKEVIELD